AGEAPGKSLQVGKAQQLVEDRGALICRKASEIGIEIEVFLDAQIFIEAEALRHIADRRLDAAGVLARVEAEHGERARIGRKEASHQPHQRRLAGAIGSDEAGDLTALDRGRNLIEGGGSRSERLADAFDTDEIVAHGVSLSLNLREVHSHWHALAKSLIW